MTHIYVGQVPRNIDVDDSETLFNGPFNIVLTTISLSALSALLGGMQRIAYQP